MCIWAAKRKTSTEKVYFYSEMASVNDLESSSKIIFSLGDFNGHVGKCAENLKVYMEEIVLRKEMQKEEYCWSSVMKKNCAWQTLGFMRQTERKSLISVG